MADTPKHRDAHARPPKAIREIYKKYQKADPEQLLRDMDLIDFASANTLLSQCAVKSIPGKSKDCNSHQAIRDRFLSSCASSKEDLGTRSELNMPSGSAYEFADLPGKFENTWTWAFSRIEC